MHHTPHPSDDTYVERLAHRMAIVRRWRALGKPFGKMQRVYSEAWEAERREYFADGHRRLQPSRVTEFPLNAS